MGDLIVLDPMNDCECNMFKSVDLQCHCSLEFRYSEMSEEQVLMVDFGDQPPLRAPPAGLRDRPAIRPAPLRSPAESNAVIRVTVPSHSSPDVAVIIPAVHCLEFKFWKWKESCRRRPPPRKL